MTIVHDPALDMGSSTAVAESKRVDPFMAPELLVPSKFGMDKCKPTKEADIYAMAMVIYQVLAARFLVHNMINSFYAGAHRNAAIW